ncbi:MAG TPA: Fic family protein [Gaiellaceae bacterium]|jgi:Fic family protein
MTTVYPFLEPTDDELAVLELIDGLRQELRHRVAEPRRWTGGLRRLSEARNVQASNSIEGYNATLDDVVAVADGEAPLDADAETRMAVAGYQEAMTYVLQASQDDIAIVDEGVVKALHFMMLKHDLSKFPGRWRPGDIYVRRENTGEIVYTGPDAGLIDELVGEMLERLDDAADRDIPVLIRAAMVHLNFVMIHPFKDGNGRMARCLQTLVLAREKIVAPVFSSIEEYLGANTSDYYDVLATVGRGTWNPQNDPRPWIDFSLLAHYRQAATLLRRLQEYESLWVALSHLAAQRRLPERCIGPLCEAAYGFRIRRATYVKNVDVTFGEPIADLTASRDLKALVNAGFLEPIGDTRGRYYVATNTLKQHWQGIREARRGRGNDDPFEIVRERRQLTMDLQAS